MSFLYCIIDEAGYVMITEKQRAEGRMHIEGRIAFHNEAAALAYIEDGEHFAFCGMPKTWQVDVTRHYLK